MLTTCYRWGERWGRCAPRATPPHAHAAAEVHNAFHHRCGATGTKGRAGRHCPGAH